MNADTTSPNPTLKNLEDRSKRHVVLFPNTTMTLYNKKSFDYYIESVSEPTIESTNWTDTDGNARTTTAQDLGIIDGHLETYATINNSDTADIFRIDWDLPGYSDGYYSGNKWTKDATNPNSATLNANYSDVILIGDNIATNEELKMQRISTSDTWNYGPAINGKAKGGSNGDKIVVDGTASTGYRIATADASAYFLHDSTKLLLAHDYKPHGYIPVAGDFIQLGAEVMEVVAQSTVSFNHDNGEDGDIAYTGIWQYEVKRGMFGTGVNPDSYQNDSNNQGAHHTHGASTRLEHINRAYRVHYWGAETTYPAELVAVNGGYLNQNDWNGFMKGYVEDSGYPDKLGDDLIHAPVYNSRYAGYVGYPLVEDGRHNYIDNNPYQSYQFLHFELLSATTSSNIQLSCRQLATMTRNRLFDQKIRQAYVSQSIHFKAVIGLEESAPNTSGVKFKTSMNGERYVQKNYRPTKRWKLTVLMDERQKLLLELNRDSMLMYNFCFAPDYEHRAEYTNPHQMSGTSDYYSEPWGGHSMYWVKMTDFGSYKKVVGARSYDTENNIYEWSCSLEEAI